MMRAPNHSGPTITPLSGALLLLAAILNICAHWVWNATL